MNTQTRAHTRDTHYSYWLRRPLDLYRVHVAGSRRCHGPRCSDVRRLVEGGLALLTGARDRRGGAVLTLPAPRQGRDTKQRAEEYRLLLAYLTSIPR